MTAGRARAWREVAQAYASSFAELCAGPLPTLLADLLEDPAGDRPPGAALGHRLLDVGCGTGELVAAAAGTGVRATAVEPDAAMLALARSRLPHDVTTVEAALPDLPFVDGGFDRVVANFVVNHLGDPRAGVRELARVTAPGGLVALTIWPLGGNQAQADLFRRVQQDSGAVAPEGLRLPAELDFERTVAGLATLAGEAGLVVKRSTELSWVWEVAVERLWAGVSGGVSVLGVTYLAQPPEVRAEMARLFAAYAAGLGEDGRLRLPVTAAYVLARRPD